MGSLPGQWLGRSRDVSEVDGKGEVGLPFARLENRFSKKRGVRFLSFGFLSGNKLKGGSRWSIVN